MNDNIVNLQLHQICRYLVGVADHGRKRFEFGRIHGCKVEITNSTPVGAIREKYSKVDMQDRTTRYFELVHQVLSSSYTTHSSLLWRDANHMQRHRQIPTKHVGDSVMISIAAKKHLDSRFNADYEVNPQVLVKHNVCTPYSQLPTLDTVVRLALIVKHQHTDCSTPQQLVTCIRAQHCRKILKFCFLYDNFPSIFVILTRLNSGVTREFSRQIKTGCFPTHYHPHFTTTHTVTGCQNSDL